MPIKLDEEAKQKVEAEFAELDAALQEPGVLAVMELYGKAERLLQQADAYMSAMVPPPRVYTSNHT